MQCCCSIETYAPAVLFAVALVTVCLRCDVATPRGGVAAGILFVLAVGMHATNVLLAPFLFAVLWLRLRGRLWTAAIPVVGTVLLGGLLIATALAGWPAEWQRLVPQADPEPSLGVGGRLGRVVYGWLRTIAWLPPSWEVTKTYLAIYAICGLITAALVVSVARGHFSLASRHGVLGLCSLIAAPFFVLGIKYYPSDPERWLFLVPMAWLFVGWIWADYLPRANALITRGVAQFLLTTLVVALALFNVVYKLWPEARSNRYLAGLSKLSEIAHPGDLVVAIGEAGPLTEEFIVGRPVNAQFLSIADIMLKVHPSDVKAGADTLRQHVRAALLENRRVYVFAFLGEDLAPGRGFPWAWVEPAGYVPRTMLDVLGEFQQEEIIPATREQSGTYRLHLR